MVIVLLKNKKGGGKNDNFQNCRLNQTRKRPQAKTNTPSKTSSSTSDFATKTMANNYLTVVFQLVEKKKERENKVTAMMDNCGQGQTKRTKATKSRGGRGSMKGDSKGKGIIGTAAAAINGFEGTGQ